MPDSGIHSGPSHPIVTAQSACGVLTAENPRFPASAHGGNAGLEQDMRSMGLQFEPTTGKYGAPENSYFVHGATHQQLFDLGHRYGQEAVVASGPSGRFLLHTHGPDMGKAKRATNVQVSPQEPPDYWTKLPGEGYVQLSFDDPKLEPLVHAPHPTITQPTTVHAPMSKHEIGHALYQTLTKVLKTLPNGG